MAFDTTTFWSKADKYLMNCGVPITPTIITKAKGTMIYDINGRAMMDFTSGQMSASLGHCHPEITEVANKYASELTHLVSTMVPVPVVDLAEKLGSILPAPLEKSFFLSTGSESVEAAINIAKCATGKFEIVAFSSSYHGVTSGGASATYSIGRKHGKPMMPGQLSFPAPNPYRSPFRKADGSYDWEAEMAFGWMMIDQQTVGSLAAFLFEPIMSAGGIFEPPEGYIKKLSMECKRRGMLLIADEAQTGLGRTGEMFGFMREDIVPDILALSKSLGCGFALSSVSTTDEIAKAALENNWFCVTTHLNDPLPAAIGCKVIDIILRDNIVQHVKERGQQLREGLLRLKEKYWCIGDIRGRGLLQGMELIADPVTKANNSELGAAVCRKALELGLSTQAFSLSGACCVFRLAPPMNISAEEIDLALMIMDKSFEAALTPETHISEVVQAHL